MSNKKHKKNIYKHKISIGVLCLLSILIVSNSNYTKAENLNDSDSIENSYFILQFLANDTIASKKNKQFEDESTRRIKLVYASKLIKRLGIEYEVFLDSVELEHEGATLLCDSAYFDPIHNSFEAFGDVKMNEGDSIFIYGDYLDYDGNTLLLKVRNNVILENKDDKLFTDSLNFDRVNNVGYYNGGGTLVDTINTLTSEKGFYETEKKIATFIDNVILDNPNYKIYTDTLIYNTETKIANIVSATKIVSDSGVIYGNRGNFNTITKQAILLDKSKIEMNEGSRILIGDSIVYDKDANLGKAYGNIFLQDTIQDIILKGHYGFYDANTDYAFATDSAELINYSKGDSLFLHADILEVFKTTPSTVMKLQKTIYNDSVFYDSVKVEQNNFLFKAYNNVRFFKSDLQGVCDSLVFNTTDSLIKMFKQPILWNEGNQLTGDTISIRVNNNSVDWLYVKNNAFSIEQKDSIHYNQLKSRNLTINFEDGKPREIFAEGNVENITYPEEKNGDLSLLQNLLTSSFLQVWIANNTFEKMKAWPSPTGKTTPFSLIQPQDLRLEHFKWYDYLRPIDKKDIFRDAKIKTEDKRKERPKILDEDWNS